MMLTLDCFAGLSALSSLELEACGLASIPIALTALEGSLTSLAVPFNNDLQLAHEDVEILLTLRKLRRLDLRKWCVRSTMTRAAVRVLIRSSVASLRLVARYSPYCASEHGLPILAGSIAPTCQWC